MVDIVIVTHNAIDKLKKCLGSVKRFTDDYNITLVENGCTDDTPGYLKTLSGVNVISTGKNLGSAGGANVGLRSARNKYIALIDDDAEVEKDWLPKLRKCIEAGVRVGIAGCKITFPNGRIMFADHRVNPMYNVGYGELDTGQRDYKRECDFVPRTCWLLRRDLLTETVGYFDERFFPSQYEDVDFCLRARMAGYKVIYNGEVNILHHQLSRNVEYCSTSKKRFIRKWKGRLGKFPLKDSHPVDKYIASGMAYLGKREYLKALKQFKKAGALDERFSEPLDTGIALYHMRRYNEAIKELNEKLSLNPEDALAHHYLAMIYHKIGRKNDTYKEAEYMLEYLSRRIKTVARRCEDDQLRSSNSLMIDDFGQTVPIS